MSRGPDEPLTSNPIPVVICLDTHLSRTYIKLYAKAGVCQNAAVSMTKKMNYDRCFWIAISCACLLFGLLVIPNYDDGNYFYQLYNTIGLRNPFYNDFYGQYFHFMKPTTLLYALLLSGADAPSYRILALVQSAEILLCLFALSISARCATLQKKLLRPGQVSFCICSWPNGRSLPCARKPRLSFAASPPSGSANALKKHGL